MDVDLAILTLPEFDGLEAVSPKGRKIISDAHHKLSLLASKQRRRPYEYGMWFIKIRNVMNEEGIHEGCAGYCRRVGIAPQRFYECIRVHEAFLEHESKKKVLHMFPVSVQLALSRPAMADLLERAIAIARSNVEVLQEWLDEQMGVVEQKKMPPPDDDLEDDEEEDEDRYLNGDEDDEEDSIPAERTKEFTDALMRNTLSIEDPAEARDELCKILIADAQWMKKRLTTFVETRKVWGGTWYPKAERALDMLTSAIEELQGTDLIRTGE